MDAEPSRRADPIRPTDDEARALARRLIVEARHGALAVTLAAGEPYVARVAVGHDGGAPLLLVSTLATHTRALLARPGCALLLGEPGAKGDPLAHPRLTLLGQARRADKPAGRAGWLASHPKAALYYDFEDFVLLRLEPREAHLNGGFGRAYRLTPADLGPARGVA
jgi:putative heme iron utilization protein